MTSILSIGSADLGDLVFTELVGFRRFAFRLRFVDLCILERDALLAAFSTITSPVFWEFFKCAHFPPFP